MSALDPQMNNIRQTIEKSVEDYCCTWLRYKSSLIVEGHIGVTLDTEDIIWMQIVTSTSKVQKVSLETVRIASKVTVI